MWRVVLDTNIVVSGLLFGGKPAEILQLSITGKIAPISSYAILKELEGVLATKFLIPPTMLDVILAEWKMINEIVEPQGKFRVILEDPQDNRILECALSAKANMIVSGDKHLLALKVFQGIPIFTPQEFLLQYKKK